MYSQHDDIRNKQVFNVCISFPNPVSTSQVSMLQCYSETIRGNLSKVLRLKIVALVTVEVHARDVIDKLAKAGCNDINAFEWLSQLRLYWEKVRYALSRASM